MQATDAEFQLLATAVRFGGELLMARGTGPSTHRQVIDALVRAGLLNPPIIDATYGSLKWTVTDAGRAVLAQQPIEP